MKSSPLPCLPQQNSTSEYFGVKIHVNFAEVSGLWLDVSKFHMNLHDLREFDLTLHNFNEFDLTLHNFNEFDLTLHDFNEFDLTLHDFSEFDITLHKFNGSGMDFTACRPIKALRELKYTYEALRHYKIRVHLVQASQNASSSLCRPK